MCGWRMRASARTSRKNAVRREGVSTRTRLAATSAPRHRASVISPEEPLPRTVPTASDPPAAGSAAAEALVEAPGGLFAPTSSSAASISQPPARGLDERGQGRPRVVRAARHAALGRHWRSFGRARGSALGFGTVDRLTRKLGLVVRGAGVRDPLGLLPPHTRDVARATGSDLQLRESLGRRTYHISRQEERVTARRSRL